MYIFNNWVKELYNRAVNKYRNIRPVKNCIDEIVQPSQMISFYDHACNV